MRVRRDKDSVKDVQGIGRGDNKGLFLFVYVCLVTYNAERQKRIGKHFIAILVAKHKFWESLGPHCREIFNEE